MVDGRFIRVGRYQIIHLGLLGCPISVQSIVFASVVIIRQVTASVTTRYSSTVPGTQWALCSTLSIFMIKICT